MQLHETWRTMRDLLANNEGVFVGESHDQSIAPDFLITHMEDLAAAGVTTLYIEKNHQRLLSALISAECDASHYGGEIPSTPSAIMYERETSSAHVINEAKRLGIRVIGADPLVLNKPLEERAFVYDPSTGRREFSDFAYDYVLSPEMLDWRDYFASQVVEATRDGGKYIVYGGAGHSRDPEADPFFPSAGVDYLLGIPSIDFVDANVTREIFAGNGFADSARFNLISLLPNEDKVGVARIIRVSDGTADYYVPNYRETRYAERDRAKTDHPDMSAIHDFRSSQAAQSLIDAGVCETTPEDQLVRELDEIADIARMVEVQYGSSARGQGHTR